MPQIASQFLDALQRSRILPDDRLQAILARCESGEIEGESPQDLAQSLIAQRLLTRFQAAKLMEGKFRELRIGPYLLTELIGVGGMGSVYSAIDPDSGRNVAVKVLSPSFKYDAGMRTRFRMEARVGETVDHPNLLRTHEHGTTDDVFGEMDYVVMELFRGIALHELLSVHGPLSWSMACDIISQGAAALQYLHDRGLIHRDVKPDNLLIDEEGRVKLIDYGLSLTSDAVHDGKVLEEGEEFTLTMLFGHDCLGTPDYMPPEQAANSLAADARSDVYALGCTLYTMLVGRRPFPSGTREQLQGFHREEAVPHVSTVSPAVPKEIDAIVARMMAKSPDDRFQSMDSVILKLAPYATRRPVRFEYDELLRARRRLAEKKSSIARKSNPARSASGIRAQVLASHLETGVSTETAVSWASGAAQPRKPKTAPTITAAESAQQAVAAYEAPPDSSAPVRATLVFQNGMEIPIRSMHVTLGRSKENDVALPVADLSGQHCSLTFDGDRWILRDLESRNGVRLNGKKVREEVLAPGSVVTLGGLTHFRFETPGYRRGLPRWIIAAGVAVLTAAAAAAAGWWMLSQ